MMQGPRYVKNVQDIDTAYPWCWNCTNKADVWILDNGPERGRRLVLAAYCYRCAAKASGVDGSVANHD
jgi:hypothetical protein